MSDNENTVYVFVKGNKGKCAYEITDTFGAVLHSQRFDDLKDDQNKPLYQSHSDWLAVIKSLEYVRDNRGNNNIPTEPMIFIFTTYENNYFVATGLMKRNADASKMYMGEIYNLKSQLQRDKQIKTADDNVKFQYLPDGFDNKMDEVDKLLGNEKNKKSNRP